QEIYNRYRLGTPAQGMGGAARMAVEDALGRTGGKMTEREFSEQVTNALNNKDTHRIPEVAEAAQWIRRQFLNTLRDAAGQAGVFDPEELKVLGADSFWYRIYDTQKIKSDYTGFKKVIMDWLAAGYEKERARSPEEVAQWQTSLDSSLENIK